METCCADLVAALRDARTYVEASYLNITSKDGRRNYRGCLERIDAAIAKAEADNGVVQLST